MGAGEKKFDVDECYNALPHKISSGIRMVFSLGVGVVILILSLTACDAALKYQQDKKGALFDMDIGGLATISSVFAILSSSALIMGLHRRRVLAWMTEHHMVPDFSALKDYVERPMSSRVFIGECVFVLPVCWPAPLLLGSAINRESSIGVMGVVYVLVIFACYLISSYLLAKTNSRHIIVEAIALHHGVDLSSKRVCITADGKRRVVYRTRE